GQAVDQGPVEHVFDSLFHGRFLRWTGPDSSGPVVGGSDRVDVLDVRPPHALGVAQVVAARGPDLAVGVPVLVPDANTHPGLAVLDENLAVAAGQVVEAGQVNAGGQRVVPGNLLSQGFGVLGEEPLAEGAGGERVVDPGAAPQGRGPGLVGGGSRGP